MDARRGRRKRRMATTQLLSVIVLCNAALSLRWVCLAYTPGPVMIRSTAKEMFEFSSARGNVLAHAQPHRLAMAKKKRTTHVWMTAKNHVGGTPFNSVVNEGDRDGFHEYNDWLFNDRKQRVAFYGILAFLETIFWYWLAPGIDPDSRWFNPLDGELIASLLDPSTVFSPPAGSGLGFSSLLLNTFLVLPMVWSLLLLQEQKDDDVPSRLFNGKAPQSLYNRITSAIRTCVCACGFLVGGGILIPYMIFRRPMPLRQSIDPDQFSLPLRFFEEQNQNAIPESSSFLEPIGRSFIFLLVSVILISFLLPFANHHSYWDIEWNAFLERVHSSQFTALALYDFTMISISILDPMMDDAMRRGYVPGWETNESNLGESGTSSNRVASPDRWRREKRTRAVTALAPYVAIPIIGPVAWICLRPRYDLSSTG